MKIKGNISAQFGVQFGIFSSNNMKGIEKQKHSAWSANQKYVK